MNAQQESNVVEVFLPYWDSQQNKMWLLLPFGCWLSMLALFSAA
jgi:hypothetical protein